MDACIGTWTVDRSKDVGVEAFCKALGLPAEAAKESLVVELAKEGSKFKITVNQGSHPPCTNVVEIGKPCSFQTPDGNKFQVTTTEEGGKVKESYSSDKGVAFETTREVKGNQMTTVTKSAVGSLTQVFNKS